MALSKLKPNSFADAVEGNPSLIINGDMAVAQRGTSHSDLSGYGLDRFTVASSDDAAVTVSQSTTVPSGEGFKNSMKFDVTTADTSIGAAQYYQFIQNTIPSVSTCTHMVHCIHYLVSFSMVCCFQ